MIAMAADFEATDRVSISPRWRGSWKSGFLDALEQVRQSDPASWPQRLRKHGRRTTEDERERIDQLCKSRDKIAEGLGIESSLLGPRAVMEEIVLGRDGEGAGSLMTWQRELLVEALQQVGPATERDLVTEPPAPVS
jgi:ribonuclease D